MSWKDYALIIAIASCLAVPVNYFFIISPIMEDMNKEGTVTDKFITHDWKGNPEYYFVLDGKDTVETVEKHYYSLEIGDYYDPFP